MEQINRFSVKPKGIPKRDTAVVICSATSLFRMKTFGPKCLFVYDNVRLIEHQVNAVRNVNHDTDIVVTVGHMGDKLIKNNKYNIRIIENQLYATSGIAEEIRLALNATNAEQVIVVDGDTWFDINAFRTVFYSHESCLLVGPNMPDEEPGVIVNQDYAYNLAYDISPKWCQMCLLSKNELKLARKILNSRERGHLVFHEIINSIIESGGKFRAVKHKDAKVIKINNPKVLKNARACQEI